MSKSSRILPVLAGLTVLIVAGFSFLQLVGSRGSAVSDVDFATGDDGQIERGRYLALAGNCSSCHTTASGEYMAGGLGFETPFGTIYSTNITPDPDTGIGNWSGQEFLDSMRHGVRPNGEHLYPVFPYTAFTKGTDEDVAALYAYFKSIPAVKQAAPENDVSFPFNIRSLMAVWKAMFFEAGEYVADDSQSDEWNRGAYLVEALAHCSACHSPRNVLGAEDTDRVMAGGTYIDKVRSGALRPWVAPNLTSAPRGLSLWPAEDVVAYLKTGRNSFLETFGPMNEVILNSTRHLSGADIRAMVTYLKDLPPHELAAGVKPEATVMGRGRTIYNLHCGTCHLPTGLGSSDMGPRLNAGSLVVQAEDPASMINVILYGPELPDLELPPKWRNPMDEFQYLLDDDEVAAVASYIRNSWDNAAGRVTAEQVSRQR